MGSLSNVFLYIIMGFRGRTLANQHQVFLFGREIMGIFLRPAQEKDVGFLMQVKNNHILQKQAMSHPYDYLREDVLRWIVRYRESEDSCLLVICLSVSDEPIGYINVHHILWKNRTAYFGIIIHPSNQRKGYGQTSVELLFDWVKENLQLRKLLIEVLASNYGARELYLKLDFKEAGILKNHFLCDDLAQDVIVMEREL